MFYRIGNRRSILGEIIGKLRDYRDFYAYDLEKLLDRSRSRLWDT